MSITKRISAEQRQQALDQLLLPLGPHAMPFALLDDEVNYGPDDWAWLFLSIDQNYHDAYAASDKGDSSFDLSHDLVNPEKADVRMDRDGSCARRFGLAAWLNPSTISLPKLKNKNDSWFFPLKRPIAEDYRRHEVSDEPYVRVGPLYARHLDKFHHLVANEATFGYRRPRTAPTGVQAPDSTLGITWAAIDCSIPPDAQVNALRALATTNRERLMEFGWQTHDNPGTTTILPTGQTDTFEHMRFMRASCATKRVTGLSDLWRAVAVDSLGPIVSQIEAILKGLRVVHQDLIERGFAEPALFRRFKNNLTSAKDRDGQFRHGGCYLKALFVIAELSKWGYSPNEIAEITGISDEKGRYENFWRQQFHEEIDAYVDEAENMMNGGYRWLIQSQKPDAN